MIKLLTIGNSFADNATKYLEQMFLASDIEFMLGRMNIGGCSLEKHWNLSEQCVLLPDVKPYQFYKTGSGIEMSSLIDALISEQWDYVTLQQVSDLSFLPESYFPYIEKLHTLVSKYAPQAEIMIHQTWAYRADAPELVKYEISQEEMFLSLEESYGNAARRLRCRVIPCGEAFQKAREVFVYTPDKHYDFVNPKPLQLPNQENSLIVGWHWKTGNTSSGKAELHMDGRHGNEKGCYLVNAVFFEAFSGLSILDNIFSPKEFMPEALMSLKNIAHETVEHFLKHSNT